ncbi:TetR/AcrR family transcriptional regulator [Nocardiopsis trehalosi]|uniref:TetR/AcrR family transcriptional regulator n=1 Tax=Nocardiopsis trehalosi TaxID=109329 RepID=UPI000830CF4C|nr:TetR family transcriptional regulator [Nocardiopsis trehalosi]
MGEDAGAAVTAADRTPRSERAGATRELILAAAERLYAEHGVSAVSNRQVGEAAGQGNTAAVGYRFGAKADLVRVIARRRNAAVERLRGRMLAELGGSPDVRDSVSCLVHPPARHLADLGAPTWFARFSVRVLADPALRPIMAEEALGSPSLRRVLDGVDRRLPDLPAGVRAERKALARHLMTHMPAERERALAEGRPTHRPTRHDAATGLVDALVGLYLAPVTRPPAPKEER